MDVASRPAYEKARKYYFDAMFPSKEFMDEVAINGYTMKNKYIHSCRYLVPRQFVDRRNWPESKIYEIMEKANAILRGEVGADGCGVDASASEGGPSYTY